MFCFSKILSIIGLSVDIVAYLIERNLISFELAESC